jgi:hypothetical protein
MPRIVERCAVFGVPSDFSRLVGLETRVLRTTSHSNQSVGCFNQS